MNTTYLLIGLWLFCGYTAMRWTLQKTELIKSFGDAVLACLAICYGPILWPVTLWARWQAQQTWRRLREPKPEPKPLKWLNRLFGIKALLFAALLMGGCGSSLTVNGHVYECYGLADEFSNNPRRDKAIVYDFKEANVFWSVILSETVIVPIWLAGWELWCPEKLQGYAPDLDHKQTPGRPFGDAYNAGAK
jgi:hypothetical protein